MAKMNHLTPRLCHIKKWAEFPCYGFTLLEDKRNDRRYAYEILVDHGSLAHDGGLLDGDILIEVNGVNIEEETYDRVIQRILESGDEILLLVVDKETDKFYKGQGIKVTSAMPGIEHLATKPKFSVTNPEHAVYDRELPVNIGTPQINPYHTGYDQLNYGQAPGVEDAANPMIQQPISSTMNRTNLVVVNEHPTDLTIPAVLACLCCCWPVGLCAICFACKAKDSFDTGNIEEGNRNQHRALLFIVSSVILGIIAISVLVGVRYLK